VRKGEYIYMLVNEMKKGQRGIMKGTGWEFEIQDNKKGIIRMALVHGIYSEIGSIYVDDIRALIGPDGEQMKPEFTPAQVKNIQRKNEALRFWS